MRCLQELKIKFLAEMKCYSFIYLTEWTIYEALREGGAFSWMTRSCVDLTVFTLSQIGAISLMNESGPPPIEGSVQSLSMWGVSILRIKIIEPVHSSRCFKSFDNGEGKYLCRSSFVLLNVLLPDISLKALRHIPCTRIHPLTWHFCSVPLVQAYGIPEQ